MINDQDFVDSINALNPLWTAGANTRFDGVPVTDLKSLNGLKPGWESTMKAYPKEVISRASPF